MGRDGIFEHCVLFFVLYSLICSCLGDNAEDKRQVYIVYMGGLPNQVHSSSQLQKHHQKIVRGIVATRFHNTALITSYKRSFNGFAAYLTEQEKQKLASHEGVVSIFPSKMLQLQTTRSWDYLGLSENMVKAPQQGNNIIIGILDSGIWPKSESFSDTGFGRVPKKWKGVCKGGKNFTCNKKLIGARYYDLGFVLGDDTSAWDGDGHGTHTASIAVGSFVRRTSFYGIARGTARGGLPSARIAAYKVCAQQCSEKAILSAFDDAIADGVDIISISVGNYFGIDLKVDSIAIGALHAMQRGVLTVQAGGNSGPAYSSVNGVAPWILSVAASTMDRGIVTTVTLGNGKTFVGKGVNPFKLNGTTFPVVYGKSASKICSSNEAKKCLGFCLDNSLVKGKIVLCDPTEDIYEGAEEALRAGALGVIMQLGPTFDVSYTYPLPAAAFNTKDFSSIRSYVTSFFTKNAKAFISPSQVIKNADAPKVASFSSRGPNNILPNILKPDITAPGVEILAAFSPVAMVSPIPQDKRSVNYQILSGTSMACPHVSGAAAFVKAIHPDWSISAIKSALMTTAQPMDRTKDNEFSFGVGLLNPVNATKPGLVYETYQDDYIKLLCKVGYTDANLREMFRNKTIACATIKQQAGNVTLDDFNYPSMAIKGKKGMPMVARLMRTVTNVGSRSSTYKASVTGVTKGVQVTVQPQTLSFQKLNEKKTFSVDVKVNKVQSMVSASLEWSDGEHLVRSPIVVY